MRLTRHPGVAVGSGARPTFRRRAGFRQKRIRSFTQTEAGQSLAEFRELDRELSRVRGFHITLLGRRDIRQRFAGHPSYSFRKEFG
jgi:hypothetical protein